jgi:hypothetical protein
MSQTAVSRFALSKFWPSVFDDLPSRNHPFTPLFTANIFFHPSKQVTCHHSGCLIGQPVLPPYLEHEPQCHSADEFFRAGPPVNLWTLRLLGFRFRLGLRLALRFWPNSFLLLSRKISLSGRMIPSAPSPISKFARLYTSWFMFVRSMYYTSTLSTFSEFSLDVSIESCPF